MTDQERFPRINIQTQALVALSLFMAIALPCQAQYKPSAAFNTVNLNPMIQIFGLPTLANRTLDIKGTYRVELEQQVANYHSQSAINSESITLDGETWRTNISLAAAVTNKTELSVSIPYIRHSAGYLDDLIYDWHDLFGMPQGERTEDSNDNFDIQYTDAGKSQARLASPASGIGDIRLKYLYKLPAIDREIILQSELKLPTGSSEKLTGSGGTDLSIGFMLNDPVSLQNHDINLWAGSSATYLGDADGSLSDRQKNLVWSARAGMGWSLNESVTLKTQLDTHSAVYQSETDELGKAALMLTVGGDIHFSSLYRLELSAIEDLITESSPDIVFTAKFTALIE
ncbi:DUF3187 family protein [Alkalimarinus coralli]|uniref:DUF3187 family protein n=1 Tax=Alkalimarinus coralli TaxID=2935863 RepID=UPI00202BA354|nr:DUF3187 family protein [Alkalimarinus coralli]